MKNFLKSIPNKLKAIYLIWFFIHFAFWLHGGGKINLETMSKRHGFFPLIWNWDINWNIHFELSLRTEINYGLDVFILYMLTPIVILYFFRLWKKKEN